MRNLRKQRRIRIILASVVLLAGATAMIGYAMRDGIQFFRTPSEVMANTPAPSEVFRIGGMVEDGTLSRSGTLMTFHITDGETSFPVRYDGIVPDLFSEGEGTIATGRVVNGQFEATEILAKHDESYMPKELADMGITN